MLSTASQNGFPWRHTLSRNASDKPAQDWRGCFQPVLFPCTFTPLSCTYSFNVDI